MKMLMIMTSLHTDHHFLYMWNVEPFNKKEKQQGREKKTRYQKQNEIGNFHRLSWKVFTDIFKLFNSWR